jgi:hypothetical protein
MADVHEAVRLKLHTEDIAMMHNGYFRAAAASIVSAALFCAAQAHADEAPAPSKHQMMKDCMAKQKASNSGRLKEDMEKSCRDLSKTEKQNADRASAAEGAKAAPGTPQAAQDTASHD